MRGIITAVGSSTHKGRARQTLLLRYLLTVANADFNRFFPVSRLNVS
jgi:hypothetical protein